MKPSGIETQFPGGVNTLLGSRLPDGFFVWGENVSIRGGKLATRPGMDVLCNLPAGTFQGATVFYPEIGFPEVVAVVDGQVHVSAYPFDEFVPVGGATLSPTSRKVYFAQATKFTNRNEDGSVAVTDPQEVLMIQDGVAPGVSYDGSTVTARGGLDKLPQGTLMVWYANRLWVARGRRVWASDIGDPFSFIEQFYLGGSDSFLFESDVTAFSSLVSPGSAASQPLLIFTRGSSHAVLGYVPRDQWTTSPGFLVDFFPKVGCTGSRAHTIASGLLFWHSSEGLVSFDTARQANVTSIQPVLDNELQRAKAYTAPVLDEVTIAAHKNHLLVSVPYGGEVGSQVWVLDLAPIQTTEGVSGMAWAGAWVGSRPVEWLPVREIGPDRLLAISADGRLVEWFRGTEDFGEPITATAELRANPAGSPFVKQLQYVQGAFDRIRGTVDLSVDWRGLRGAYKNILNTRIMASHGYFSPASVIGPGVKLETYGTQFRRIKTHAISPGEIPDGTHVFQGIREHLDWAFQIRLRWSGVCSLSSLELSTDEGSPTQEARSLAVTQSETEETRVALSGEPLTGASSVRQVFDGSASTSLNYLGVSETGSATAVSPISEAHAERVATARAERIAYEKLKVSGPVVLGIFDIGT